MADLNKQTIDRAGDGLTPAYANAAGGGDKFVPDEDTFLHIKNGHTSPQTATIATPKTVAGQAIADLAVVVPNAAERMVGPFPSQHYGDPTDSGKAAITYSGVTALTVAVLKLGES